MPSRHKTPLLGWHPPAELAAWVRAEAARRGITRSEVIRIAIEFWLAQEDGFCQHCGGSGCLACDSRHLPAEES